MSSQRNVPTLPAVSATKQTTLATNPTRTAPVLWARISFHLETTLATVTPSFKILKPTSKTKIKRLMLTPRQKKTMRMMKLMKMRMKTKLLQDCAQRKTAAIALSISQ